MPREIHNTDGARPDDEHLNVFDSLNFHHVLCSLVWVVCSVHELKKVTFDKSAAVHRHLSPNTSGRLIETEG